MDSTPIPASLRTLLVAVAAVLALVGGIGVATGAADDGGDDVTTAGGKTTTTLTVTDDTIGGAEDGTTTTALAGVGGTTTTGKSGSSTKPGSTATTIVSSESNACGAPPASTTDPGPIQPPAVGVYKYVLCSDGSAAESQGVREGQSGGGRTRRSIDVKFGNLTGQATVAYGAEGVLQEVLDIPAYRVHCDWNPDVVQYPAALSVGATWTSKSSCTAPPAGKIELTGTGKITGRVMVTVGNVTVNAWVVEGTITTTAAGQTNTIKETDYFDPTRGIELYKKTVAPDGQGGTITAVRRLASLTPQAS